MCMYEESARVPLFMKFPKKFTPSEKLYDQVVSHIDVLPTLCDYLQVDSGNEMDGTSLMPLLRGESRAEDRNSAYIQYDGNGSRSNFQRCMIWGRWKLIVDLFKDETFYELYDLEEDVQETSNLMFDGKHDEIAEEMANRLAAHSRETGDLLTMAPFDAAGFRRKYEAFPVL